MTTPNSRDRLEGWLRDTSWVDAARWAPETEQPEPERWLPPARLRMVPLSLYFDRAGNPIDIYEWMVLIDQWSYRNIAKTKVGSARVSTVWVGLDHGFGLGPSLIFETMIFGGEHDCCQWRFSTEAAAIHGHTCVAYLLRQERRNKVPKRRKRRRR